MSDDKRKAEALKLIRDINKKKKEITPEHISNYLSMMEAKKIKKFPDGEYISKNSVHDKINKSFELNEVSKDAQSMLVLKQQKKLLDDIIEEDNSMKIGKIVASVVGIVVFVWLVSSFISDDNKKNTSYSSSSTSTYNKSTVEVVMNSPWDSSVSQVEDYLKKTLKDPDSYQSIEWYKVKKTSNGFKVLHKFRAKNSFGGYKIGLWEFFLDSEGKVISSIMLTIKSRLHGKLEFYRQFLNLKRL